MKRGLVVAFLLLAGGLGAAPDFAAARALFEQKHFAEARDALEKIVAAEPDNAAACHYLGRALLAQNDRSSLEQAVKWLSRAVELEPNNARYLGIFGGASLQLAERTRSPFAATHGRDAMEKALTLDPDYLEAREGLFQFYQRAPWPLGSSAKAAAHLAEIRRRDPGRDAALAAGIKANAKEFAAAFALCEEALRRKPDAYLSLYQFGRTASLSGERLAEGLASLERCLKLEPQSPAEPTHSYVWLRIGRIQEQLKHVDAARSAYENALKLDPDNKGAADALATLK